MTQGVSVPWDAIEAFVAADRRFLATVRDVAERLRGVDSLGEDLAFWLEARVPEIERTHRELLVAWEELRAPAPEQSLDWLVTRIHQMTGGRQTLGVSYSPDWNPRIIEVLARAIPSEPAVALQEAVSAVSAAAAHLNRVCSAMDRGSNDDLFRGRTMYKANDEWFWERRDESENNHLWNGLVVPIGEPNYVAAIYFAGEAEGYGLPVYTRHPSGSWNGGFTYGSLLALPTSAVSSSLAPLRTFTMRRTVRPLAPSSTRAGCRFCRRMKESLGRGG